MCCNAVGPLENDAKQNGAAVASGASANDDSSAATTTMETIAMTTDKKSILSEYNRKEANAAKCGNKVVHRKSVRGKNWLENSQLAPDCGCAPNPNCEKDPLLELVRGAASTCSGAERSTHTHTHTSEHTLTERVTQ